MRLHQTLSGKKDVNTPIWFMRKQGDIYQNIAHYVRQSLTLFHIV